MLQRKSIGEVLRGITAAVLFAVILLLVVFSAVSYQRSVETQNSNDNVRAVLSYLVTAVNNDRSGEVTLRSEDGMDLVVITSRTTGMEQRIFFSDGQIYEQYCAPDIPTDPADAVVLGTAERFEVTLAADRLLMVDTEMGLSFIHIH